MISLNKKSLQPYPKASQSEWLETNGIGGWSSSSVINSHTRRYHGLLVAATVPPTQRMVLVSKLDETIVLGNQRYELGVNDYGGVIHPEGYHYLQSYSKDLVSEWVFQIEGTMIKKSITMVNGENTTVIRYEVIKSPQPFLIQFTPLVAARDYHSLRSQNGDLHWDVDFNDGVFNNKPFGGDLNIYIKIPGATYQHDPKWFLHFNYWQEQYRGLDFVEDLLNHGVFELNVEEGDVVGIIVSTDNPLDKDAIALFDQEKERKLKARSPKSKVQSPKSLDNQLLWNTLLEAADQFIVKRGESLKTVIAGYHWFTDWARDTMISLPGLCLATGRHDDAKKILAAFAQSISEGMLPNRFQDGGDVPEYNNVDGTLWFFVAVYKYWLQTKDNNFVLHEMLPKLQDIVDWHYKGTRYNIHVAEDGLLYAGETGQQLTWMDARVGDWVVTPRMGKPVEIQALWYNALMILSELYAQTGNGKAEFNIFAEKYKAMGQSVKTAFDALFWYNTGGYYYDVIDEHNVPDPSVRPNTLFAICLPFPIANGDKAQSTFQKIKEELYTPVGLRSLSPKDDRYIGSYGGGQYERDSAYHQGTVWSWLLGPYIDAVIQLDSQNGRSEANTILGNFAYHLHEACIGSVSEIFEGNAPHTPQGCIAQAWSVAELLRVIHDHQL